ncbi:MAG TPA: transcriptional repressor [Dehalococcoidia bacterium]|nr:transcriptional repressor [Dehalococcoidia bacterium]
MSCSTILKQKGYKMTPQRRLIVEYIHDNQSHLTADELISFLETRAPGINKSTVYRTLDLLEESGCVVKSEIDGHFIYHHAEEGHHHHLVCRVCGKTQDCNENLFSSVKDVLANRYGFQADFKHIMITGLCSACRKKSR